MIEEFQTASGLLSAALERYLTACSAIANCYDPNGPPRGISRGISDLIPGALESTLSYKTKLKQATTLLNQTRNIIPTITPVNTLPPDILTHVFQLVPDAQPRYSAEGQELKPFPLRYPETLSHVCSRWRHIAISSRVLWSRIDISFRDSAPGRAILVRAELFSARSDPSTLDLYIDGRPDNNPPDFEILLASFCASVAPRVKSLNFPANDFHELYFPLLQRFFPNCMPGTLTELAINGGVCALIGSSETSTGSRSCIINMSSPELEECLASVNVLRLTGAYFDWKSKVYHGLVELYLNFCAVGPDIPLAMFHMMLYNSPGLRVLDLDLRIVDIAQFNGELSHISLNDLEVLGLRWMDPNQCQTLLQFLHPGKKPLRLSLQYTFNFYSQFDDELTEFLARSNVTELYIQCQTTSQRYRYIDVLELLNSPHLPHLRTLSLAKFVLRPKTSTQTQLQNHDIDSLRLTQCHVVQGDLQQLVQTLQISALTLAGCSVHSQTGLVLDEHQIAETVPMIRFLSAPKDFREWDPWCSYSASHNITASTGSEFEGRTELLERWFLDQNALAVGGL